MTSKLHPLATVAALLTLPIAAMAAPYASGIRVAGSDVSFILNEAADNVTIEGVGGAPLNLGALGAGRHSFSLGSFSSWEIKVARNAPAGFTPVDDSANLFTNFDRPGGLAINTIPSSPYFGSIYVNQNRSLNGGNPVVTAAGRTMGNGVYALTADRLGVDLPTWTVPANPNDPTLAKVPAGITVDLTSSSSFYRIGMDDAGNILASDWTNNVGGLKVLSADLTSGAVLLREEAGPTGGVASDDSDEFGPLPLHGSINGEPQATGVWGVNLSVAAMDEDLDADLEVTTASDGNNVWRWNVGATTSNYAGAPDLEIAVGDLHTSTGMNRSTSGVTSSLSGESVGTHSDGSPVFLDFNIGVTANAQYNRHFDKWYLSGSRANGNDSSSLVILSPEGAGGDGRDITVDWASKQFTIDNGLDGYVDVTGDVEPLSLDPSSDIFRQAHAVAFSPDNTVMYVMRRTVAGENPVLGPDSDFGTRILAVPLDANGIPDIQISDNGTPGDTSDDFITNITPIAVQAGVAQGSFSAIKTDAAGNLYFTDNIGEGLEYFSLGGNTLATTTSAGTFLIETVTGGVPGDANGDGNVDLLDLDILGANFGTTMGAGVGQGDFNGDGGVDLLDLDILGANFGTMSPALAVPEPSGIVIALATLAVASRGRRLR